MSSMNLDGWIYVEFTKLLLTKHGKTDRKTIKICKYGLKGSGC